MKPQSPVFEQLSDPDSRSVTSDPSCCIQKRTVIFRNYYSWLRLLLPFALVLLLLGGCVTSPSPSDGPTGAGAAAAGASAAGADEPGAGTQPPADAEDGESGAGREGGDDAAASAENGASARGEAGRGPDGESSDGAPGRDSSAGDGPDAAISRGEGGAVGGLSARSGVISTPFVRPPDELPMDDLPAEELRELARQLPLGRVRAEDADLPAAAAAVYLRRREAAIGGIIRRMSLERKVGQLLVPAVSDIGGMGTRRYGEALSSFLETVQPGGVLFFADNISDPGQVRRLVRELQGARDIPLFVAVDEEGGLVSRLSRNPGMPATEIPSARRIGDAGDPGLAYELARVSGRELRALGFNMNFAPVADVLTNPANEVIGSRAYGSDPETVGRFVEAVVSGLESTGVSPVLKHFPGHGDTDGDTHEAPVVSPHGAERLRRIELVPFTRGISAGAPAVMTGHIALPEVTGDSLPATFSSPLIREVLREDLGFDGLVVTDALNMGAVTSRYDPEDAALRAIDAGADLLLRPLRPASIHGALVAAVREGRISELRIDESLRRILQVKVDYGILVPDDVLFRTRAADNPPPPIEVLGSEAHRRVLERLP